MESHPLVNLECSPLCTKGRSRDLRGYRAVFATEGFRFLSAFYTHVPKLPFGNAKNTVLQNSPLERGGIPQSGMTGCVTFHIPQISAYMRFKLLNPHSLPRRGEERSEGEN